MTNPKIIRSMPELHSHEYWRHLVSIVLKYSTLPCGERLDMESDVMSKLKEFLDLYNGLDLAKETPMFLTVYKSGKSGVRYTSNGTFGLVISTATIKKIIREISKNMMTEIDKNSAYGTQHYAGHYSFCLLDLVQHIHESGVDAYEFNFARSSFCNGYNPPPMILSKRYSDLHIEPHGGYIRVPEHSVVFRTYGGFWRDGREIDGIMDNRLLFAEVSRDCV